GSAIDASAAKAVFDLIMKARVSSSALEARAWSILSPDDGIVMNRDRVLHEARRAAVSLAEGGYRPPQPRTLEAGPPTLRATLLEGAGAEADVEIAGALATILAGGGDGARVSEATLLELEREAV